MNELIDELDDYNRRISYDLSSVDDFTCFNFNNTSIDDLKIIHFNVRSLNKNFSEFQAYLSYLKVVFDVIVLFETWQIYDPNDYRIESYDMCYNESKQNKADGCLIYVKHSLNPAFSILCSGKTKVIKTILQHNNKNVGILSTYRPPSYDTDNFLLDLHDILTLNKKENSKTDIFIGDINIDLLVSDVTNNVYLNLLLEFGFIQTVTTPTRVTETTKSCIDHIFLKNCDVDMHDKSFVLQDSFSDHYAIIIVLNSGLIRNPTCNSNIPSYNRQLNMNKLKHYLANEDWAEIYDQKDVNSCTDLFMSKLSLFMKDSTTCIHFKETRLKPWITQGILNSIRTRNILRKISILNPSDSTAVLNFRRYRNILNKSIQRLKNMYYVKLFEQSNSDPKGMWNTIRKVTNTVTTSNAINSIRNNKLELITEKSMIADEFNEYFSRIGMEIMQSKILNNSVPSNLKHIKHNNYTLFLNPICETELYSYINQLKKSNNNSHDGISSKVIKIFSSFLVKPLVFILNLIMSTGVYPDGLKRATIIPLYKAGDKTDMNNYRPIAITSAINKIVEKCLKTRLVQFLDKHNIINSSQYGFRQGLSTDDAIINVTKYVNDCFNKGEKCIGVFLDLRKAFDTISHAFLVDKLEKIGVRGTALNLFESYLQGRKQRVVINSDTYSDDSDIFCGVPQGTVLGPVLFLIYINDLMNTEINGEIICYADDTVLLVRADNWRNALMTAEDGLCSISRWLDSNLLTLNLEKTKFIKFTTKSINMTGTEKLLIHSANCESVGHISCNCNTHITCTDSVKYLGIFIDQNLKWKIHTNYLNEKIRKTIHKFKQLSYIIDLKWLRIIYQSLVESLIGFGILAWGAAYKTALTQLQVTQKWILRVILGKPLLYPSKLVFADSHCLSVRELFIFNTLKYMAKKENHFRGVQHGIATRSFTDNKCSEPFRSLTVCQQHICFLGPKIINLLPRSILNKCRTKTMNRCIKNWVFTNKQELMAKLDRWL